MWELAAYPHRVIHRCAGLLAILNVIAWLVDVPRRYGLGVFSSAF